MEQGIISRISIGTKMDQIYIPKNRVGLTRGSYVVVMPLSEEKTAEKIRKTKKISGMKPFFYGLREIEPIKLEIINKIFKIIGEEKHENIIITGSFLEKGFNFNDIDILIVKDENIEKKHIENKLLQEIGIKAHLICLSSKDLLLGMASDPLYENMLSRFVSVNRVVFNYKRKINYKLLDLHLLKSKVIIDNFEILNGTQKHYFVKNMIAILLFLEGKRISKDNIDRKVEHELKISLENIKQNLIEEKPFMKNFKKSYERTFDLIMRGVRNDSKQE